MVYANHYISLALVGVFVICTTHLILHKPSYSSSIARHEKRGLDPKRSLEKRAVSEEASADDIGVSSAMTKAFNYVIFDASHYSGSLAFLDVHQEGWRLLVVNLKNLSQLTTCRSCFLLKDEWIKSNVVDKWWNTDRNLDIDSNGLAKLAAYAYVLSHGAPWIFTTDQHVPVPIEALSKVARHEVKTGLVYQGPLTIFEPCNHFMDPYTWRGRGFHKDQGRYNVKVVSSHSIYHVVNECTKQDVNEQAVPSPMDNRAPSPYIMPGTFAAVDFNNVLVSNLNAWTLVASLFARNDDNTTPSPKAVQINLMVQRVLWDTPSAIGFVANGNDVSLASQCTTCDLETNLNNSGEAFLNNLNQWRCDFFEPVPKCLVKLSKEDFVRYKGLENVISLWVVILESYGWNSIERVVFSDERLVERFSGIPVYFSPAKSLHKNPSNDTRPPNWFRELCRKNNKHYQAKIPEQHAFRDIILIVVFNFGVLVSNIPILEYAYGRHFKHIIYCSESIAQFETRYQNHFNSDPVTFIEVKHRAGYWAQSCMSATMKMGYDVIGFLQLSDDVLLNAWNLYKLPFDRPWFQSNIRVANIHHLIVPDVWVNNYWWPWSQPTGKDASVNAFNQLQAMVSNPSNGDKISKFLENMHNITNCDHCFLYEASDIFYVPSRLISNFILFSDIFFHNSVFLEIAIPTTLVGITSDAEIYRLRGNYLWFQDREKYPFVYTEHDHFYHAMKSSQLGVKRHLDFYCNNFLDRLDKDVMRSTRDYN